MTLKNANSGLVAKRGGNSHQRNNRWFGVGLSSVGVVGI